MKTTHLATNATTAGSRHLNIFFPPSTVLNLPSSLAFFPASQRTGLIDCVAVLQQAVSNDSLKTSPSSPAALLACVSLPVSLLPRLLFRLQFSG